MPRFSGSRSSCWGTVGPAAGFFKKETDMSSSGTPENSSYQRQPAPGQQTDPQNPPMAHQDPAHANDIDKTGGSDRSEKNAVACDYVDVVRLAADQPRFLLQPHLSGGAV